MRAILAAAALIASAAPAWADGRCTDAAALRANLEASQDTWTEVTIEQRAFLAGVFAMNPQTPAGLPYGDKAVLVQKAPPAKGGFVLFIDGPLACDGFPVPDELIAMLKQIEKGEILHEGKI